VVIVKKLVAVLIIVWVLTGCGTTVHIPLDSEKFEHLQDISVVDSVIMPEKAYYYGPSNGVGAALGGYIGALIAESGSTAPEQIEEALKTNNIDVGDMLLEEFKLQLSQHQKMQNKNFVGNSGNAKFNLVIEKYGLEQDGPFSSKYRPIMTVSATLINEQDETIWKASNLVRSFQTKLKGKPFSELVSDGSYLRESFDGIIKQAVTGILKEL
jgi:hypothetical protein